MTEAKRPLKVFLCHAHADREAVRALYIRLTADGVDAWLDKEKLLPGQDWELEICREVRKSDIVIVCLSREFNKAGYRQKEVRIALDEAEKQPEDEIFIIPARLEECDVPERLSRWQWVNLFEDNGYELLIRALQARAYKIGAAFDAKNEWTFGDEIIIPIASSVEHFISYLRNYLTIDSYRLQVSLGNYITDERYNGFSSEWQLLLFWLKQKREMLDGKEISVTEVGGEKIGVFSLSKLSNDRSKLRITRSNHGEQFKNFILGLIQQLQDDDLVDGTIRGLSR